MKQTRTSLILLTALVLFLGARMSGFCSEGPLPGTPVINAGELTKEKLCELKSHNGQIFYAPKGFEMSVKIKLEGPVISTKENDGKPIMAKFNVPVYFYAPTKKGEAPLFSIDGKKWEKGTDLFGGVISLGLEKQDKEPAPLFNLNMNIRLKDGEKNK